MHHKAYLFQTQFHHNKHNIGTATQHSKPVEQIISHILKVINEQNRTSANRFRCIMPVFATGYRKQTALPIFTLYNTSTQRQVVPPTVKLKLVKSLNEIMC